MLDDFVADTGYNRAYAALVLRDCGRGMLCTLDESMVEVVASVKHRRAGRRPGYTASKFAGQSNSCGSCSDTCVASVWFR